MLRVPPGFNALTKQAGASVAEVVRRHVVPVFGVNDDGEPDFEASGVLVCLGRKYLLVSAAHVFEALSRGVHLLIPGREREPLRGPKFLSEVGYRSISATDLACVELTEEETAGLGAENFHIIETLPVSTREHSFDRYLVLGFQATTQEKDSARQIYKINQTYYTAPELSQEQYQTAALDRTRQIGLYFNRAGIAGPKGRGGRPNFKGMSGGGIWKFNPYVPSIQPPLVGFLAGSSTKNTKIIFGARLAELIRM